MNMAARYRPSWVVPVCLLALAAGMVAADAWLISR